MRTDAYHAITLIATITAALVIIRMIRTHSRLDGSLFRQRLCHMRVFDQSDGLRAQP
jgi:hypothetical protein